VVIASCACCAAKSTFVKAVREVGSAADVCDGLRLHIDPLSTLRGATVPSPNNLSQGKKRRDAAVAERLFWAVFDGFQNLSLNSRFDLFLFRTPKFTAGSQNSGPGICLDDAQQLRLRFCFLFCVNAAVSVNVSQT